MRWLRISAWHPMEIPPIEPKIWRWASANVFEWTDDVRIYLLYKRKINAKRVAYGHQTMHWMTRPYYSGCPISLDGYIRFSPLLSSCFDFDGLMKVIYVRPCNVSDSWHCSIIPLFYPPVGRNQPILDQFQPPLQGIFGCGTMLEGCQKTIALVGRWFLQPGHSLSHLIPNYKQGFFLQNYNFLWPNIPYVFYLFTKLAKIGEDLICLLV